MFMKKYVIFAFILVIIQFTMGCSNYVQHKTNNRQTKSTSSTTINKTEKSIRSKMTTKETNTSEKNYKITWQSEDGKIIFKTLTSEGINTFDVIRGVFNNNGTKVPIECFLAIANRGVAYEDGHEEFPAIYIYTDEDEETLLDGKDIMGGDVEISKDNKSFVLFNEFSSDTYKKGQKIKFYQVSK